MPRAKTVYTVNLSAARNTPRNKRAGKAMKILRDFVAQHHDTDMVRISETVNNAVWQRGVENPPTTVDIQVIEEDDYVRVEHADTSLSTTSTEPATDEGAEEEEAETGAETALPDDVQETLETGTVSDAKDVLDDADHEVLEAALAAEEQGKDRKTLRRFIEHRLDETEEDAA